MSEHGTEHWSLLRTLVAKWLNSWIHERRIYTRKQ